MGIFWGFPVCPPLRFFYITELIFVLIYFLCFWHFNLEAWIRGTADSGGKWFRAACDSVAMFPSVARLSPCALQPHLYFFSASSFKPVPITYSPTFCFHSLSFFVPKGKPYTPGRMGKIGKGLVCSHPAASRHLLSVLSESSVFVLYCKLQLVFCIFF